MTSVWINGKACNQLSSDDRGLAYGDGFFTTMNLKKGAIELWPLHLKRITVSLSRLDFPRLDLPELESEVSDIAQQKGEGILKLIITRGSGGRGYNPMGCEQPVTILRWFPAVTQYQALRSQGIDLIDCQTPISGIPQLAGLKTLNRLEQVLLKQELEFKNAFEGVVCDLNGNVVECSSSNLFWRKGKQVFTPKLDLCGVDGVMRQHIIKLLESSHYAIAQVTCPPSELIAADELFITNSLMPLLPVARYNDRRFSDFSLSHCLHERIKLTQE